MMRLTDEEKAMLGGARGAGAAKAMEILCALGRINDAPDLVPVKSAQVSGISYKNIGEHGLAFLEEWSAQESEAVIPAFTNPGGADRRLWKTLGFPAAFVEKQRRVVDALERLGVKPTLSCTPYHAGAEPGCGEHIAWSESSAVCFSNSVLGARTNREGGPSAIAAALTGLTPRHGLHTDEGRRPTRVVRVRCAVVDAVDAGILGHLIGGLCAEDRAGGIPYISGVALPEGLERIAWLKALGAGMAASGAVGLYHLEGVTPEAVEQGPFLAAAAESVIESIEEERERLNSGRGKIDVVAIGCPHASPDDLIRVERLLGGRQVKIPLWISTSETVRAEAERGGIAGRLRELGAVVMADTCIVVAPLKELGIGTVATDSAKSAHYLPSHQGAGVYLGSLEENVEAALSGVWKMRQTP